MPVRYVVISTPVVSATNATEVAAVAQIPPQYHDGTWTIIRYGAFYTGVDLDITFVTMWLERQSGNTFPDPFGFPLGDFTLRSHQQGSGTVPPSFGALSFETLVPLPIQSTDLMQLNMDVFNQNNETPGIRGFVVLRKE